MSILSRPKIAPQQRFDLEDWNALIGALCGDSKLKTQKFWSADPLILDGFVTSGIGNNTATVTVADSSLMAAGGSAKQSWFVAASTEPVKTVALQAGTKNYLEVSLDYVGANELLRAFWDAIANGGVGAEFNQLTDTIENLELTVETSISGFSGDANKVPIAIVETNGSGIIKSILDQRKLFWRLGQPQDTGRDFAWGTKEEPTLNMLLSGITGTFIVGETVTFDGAETATVVDFTGSILKVKDLSAATFSILDSIVGGSGNGTLETAEDSFTGADKDIKDTKDALDALMTEVKFLKHGSVSPKKWFEDASNSMAGVTNFLNTIITQKVAGAEYGWDGTDLSITDASGSPANADELAGLRILGNSQDLVLTRQDGTGASSTLAIADGEVLFVKIPLTGDRAFSGQGVSDTNFQNVTKELFQAIDENFWIAYREGDRVYVRGYGELEPGESAPISDPAKAELEAQINANQVKSNQDRMAKLIEGGTWTWTGVNPAIIVDSFNGPENSDIQMIVNTERTGQSFTASKTTSISRIDIPLGESGSLTLGGTATLELWSTDGSSNIVAMIGTASDATSLVGLPTAPVYANTTFNFSTPVPITVGTQYAIVLNPVGKTGVGNLGWATTNTAQLAGEEASVSTDSGSSWAFANPNAVDALFQVYESAGVSDSLSLSTDAYIEVGGLQKITNTISAQTINLPNIDSVAYVDINRSGTGASVLTVNVADVDSLTLTDNMVIIARRVTAGVLVGMSCFLLKPDAYLELDGAEAEINRLLGQLKLKPHESDANKARIDASDVTLLNGTVLSQIVGTFLLDFSGAVIDFTTGIITKEDGSTALGDNFTPQTIPVSEFFWYGISLIPGVVSADNTQLATVQVDLSTATNASSSAALKPVITGEIKLGAIQVVNNAGSVELNIVRKLGVGSGSGSGGASIKASFLDPINTVLPTGATYTADGVAIVDDETVLFTNLITGNNRIYKVSGVGVSISWTALRIFSNSLDPSDGDAVRLQKGDAFKEQLAVFDDTNFLVNDIVRYFDGVSGDFWEVSSIKTSTLTDNSSGNVFSVAFSGSENIIVEYSIARGLNKETGQLYLTTNGVDAAIARNTSSLGDTEIIFDAAINGSDIELNYIASNLGADATVKYYIKRWSNSPGGPTGIPSYSGGGSTTPAAGNLGEIQFHGSSGNLDADSRLKWDSANGIFDLNGQKTKVLTGPVTLNDNQVSAATVVSYPVASFNFTIVEYSIKRGLDYRVGRLLIPNSSTVVSISDDSVDTGTTGILFSAIENAGNIEIQYTSTSTGNTGDFKYTLKQWN